jgi:hypothetical protein
MRGKKKRVRKAIISKKKRTMDSNTKPMENPPMNLYVFRSAGV